MLRCRYIAHVVDNSELYTRVFVSIHLFELREFLYVIIAFEYPAFILYGVILEVLIFLTSFSLLQHFVT
jgi:hypothetical protein